MGGYITSEGRVLQADEYIDQLEDVLTEFVEWFDQRYPRTAKRGRDLPGVTLATIAEKARKLTSEPGAEAE